jgi:hypothetical protein
LLTTLDAAWTDARNAIFKAPICATDTHQRNLRPTRTPIVTTDTVSISDPKPIAHDDDADSTLLQSLREQYSWLSPTGYGTISVPNTATNTDAFDAKTTVLVHTILMSSQVLPRDLAHLIFEYASTVHIVFIGVLMMASPSIGRDVFVYSPSPRSDDNQLCHSESAGIWRPLPRLPSSRRGAWLGIAHNEIIIDGGGRTDKTNSYVTLNIMHVPLTESLDSNSSSISSLTLMPYQWIPVAAEAINCNGGPTEATTSPLTVRYM